MLDQRTAAMVDDEAALERWAERFRASRRARAAATPHPLPETLSGLPIDPLYTPAALAREDYPEAIGYPGEYPYTRGVYTSMYRDRLFTMRQFSGFGSAQETNLRYRFLLSQGQTGLSVAFDLPTLMGRDSDDPQSQGEVGRCGVAVDSIADMDQLLSEIQLDTVTTSMTINSPAAILLAMYVVVAEERGVGRERLGGTLQNDILKEYIAQKEYIFPPHPSMRLVTDVIAFCARQVPKWHPVSISGYHIREAGSTAVQELAFTLADGFAYVEAGIAAGLHVDEFAPQLSFFFNSHIDFFEEVAKYRAARRIWSRRMRQTYGAREERSWLLRFHTQTAGCSLTAQQAENNIARTALEGLAAVLGGTQSLHTNAMDEVLALPTAKAAQIALRTQQIIAYETGVTTTIDPLGGSYFIEDLTNRMEAAAEAYFQEIDARGGVLACIESGYLQSEIADAAFRYQQQLDRGERVVVGVNAFTSEDDQAPPLLHIGQEVEVDQVRRLARLRSSRDSEAVQSRLEDLRRAAEGSDNLMLPIIEVVKVRGTEGEIIQTLGDVFGSYQERPAF